MIDKPMTVNDKRSWNNPHPKWKLFRERVDGATLDSEKRWELASVFTEAADKITFGRGMKGIHYDDGLGIVNTDTEMNTATV